MRGVGAAAVLAALAGLGGGFAGALTLFITGRYRGPWGFWVDGAKVPWREYERQ